MRIMLHRGTPSKPPSAYDHALIAILVVAARMWLLGSAVCGKLEAVLGMQYFQWPVVLPANALFVLFVALAAWALVLCKHHFYHGSPRMKLGPQPHVLI